MPKKTYQFSIYADCWVRYDGEVEAESPEEARRIVKENKGGHLYQHEIMDTDFDHDSLEFEDEGSVDEDDMKADEE